MLTKPNNDLNFWKQDWNEKHLNLKTQFTWNKNLIPGVPEDQKLTHSNNNTTQTTEFIFVQLHVSYINLQQGC